MKRLQIVAGLVSALVACPGARPQLRSVKVLSLSVATELVNATLASCRSKGNHVTVTVVDAADEAIVIMRDDGAALSSLRIGRLKATSVILFGRASGPPPNLAPGQPVPAPVVAGTINAIGGLPIVVDDVIIGVIAVSGSPNGDADIACARAGLATVATKLI